MHQRQNEYKNDNMDTFLMFNLHPESLQHRNKRLELTRISLHADILKERSGALGISFNQLMQADFSLFLRNTFDNLKGKTSNSWTWWPRTLVYAGYHSGPFEIFARAQERAFFDRLKEVFGIEGKEQIDELVEGFTSRKLDVPNFGGWSSRFDPIRLMNYKLLATS